ncbi:MAG: hypothetical protein IJI57_13300 [Flexilinea sp.]|nr:hypothetical protein [Flexilinea sp.]
MCNKFREIHNKSAEFNTPAYNGYGYPVAVQPSQEKCHLVDPPLGHPLGDYILALLAGACAGAAAAG